MNECFVGGDGVFEEKSYMRAYSTS